jgi:hypothetical protein
MAVYVDKAQIPYCGMLMNHMIADTLDELHAMAAALGLKRAWFQGKASFPHYDVCASVRAKAIKLGAVAVDGRGIVTVIRRLRAR